MSGEIVLRDVLDASVHRFIPRQLVIAGFTGREQTSVEAHLEELRDLGVEVPESVPAAFDVPPRLVTNSDSIAVQGTFTSGEVEPVVVRSGGEWLLCVGSDHTDRDLERTSIQLSKEACSKVIGRRYIKVDAVPDWDGIVIESWADGQPYQSGTLSELLPLPEILEEMTRLNGPLSEGSVLFLGTIPVIGGALRHAERFVAEMTIPDLRHSMRIEYSVQLPSGGEPA